MLGCPAFIGHLTRMTPVPCMQEVSSSSGQRVVYGGGEGTLSPRRARLYGPGGRTWDVSRDHWDPHENSSLYSLARAQSLYGGSYRVIPCDALDHNLMTPRATEELWDWQGLSVGPASSFPTVTQGAMPAMMGRVESGAFAESPHVPVVKPGERLFFGVHVTGVGEFRVRGFDATGAMTWQASQDFTHLADALNRTMFDRLPLEGVVSVRIRVTATAGHPIYFAWPSIAYADNPYVTGRGCDKAVISIDGRTAVTDNSEGFSYQIVEVGA